VALAAGKEAPTVVRREAVLLRGGRALAHDTISDIDSPRRHTGADIERRTVLFARVATFEGGDLEQVRNVNNEILVNDPDRMPAGVKRVMVLEGDQRLVITFFDSREALEAAEQKFEQLGDEIDESVRGRRIGLATYELLFDMETVS
jgi:hypothetical protein